MKKEREIVENNIKPKETLKLNSKKLKRITTDGPFGGKNREILDGEGKPMDQMEAFKEEQRLSSLQNTINIVEEVDLLNSKIKENPKKFIK